MRRLPALVLGVVTVAVVVHAALAHVAYPLAGDQALFLYAAERMANGERLYVDFWDFKQPGIFWFYQAAGSVFGWTREGVHRLEALWMLALALLAWWTARRAGAMPAAACLAPLGCVAAFYAAAGAWHLTQVESLVGLPLLGVVAAALLPAGSRAERVRQGLIMGVGTGFVAAFKLVLSIVPATIALLYAGYLLRQRRGSRARSAEVLVGAAASAGVVLLAAGAVLVWQGSGPAALWANLVFPLAAAREVPRAPVWHLVAGAKWLLGATWPFLPLALLGVALAGRNAPADGRRPLARTLLVGWIAVAGCAVLAQKLSWWEYHFAIFVAPVGLLAAIGLATLAERRPWTGASSGLYAAAVLVAGVGVAVQAWRVATKQLDSVAAESAVFEAATRSALGELPLHGEPVYVFGDPRLLLDSGGRQAIPIHGWAWELMLDAQWRELPGSLRRTAPRAVYVSPPYLELLCRRSPELVQWLREGYRATTIDATGGRWFVAQGPQPRDDGAPAWGCLPDA